ncbi:peptidoglycan DD-metalloendopeptidase family protein [Psychroserpens mesophilus]|uniref:peptidoglycan DD-metalloendopeptidase family protein n=1 Tax=Psychroserpens mesophilus TaxID=325473 RepID=UPI003D65E4AC
MTSKITLFLFVILITCLGAAQTPGEPTVSEGLVFNPNKKACVTPEQRADMIQDIQTSIETLRQENKLLFSEQRRGNHPLFIWPLQKASNVTFNEIYGIGAYVDHNSAFPNQLTDYNCGTKTYDTNAGYNHQGTDMYTWPFGWKMMDDDGVEIIAAAPGQIIVKQDGAFDRSCNFGTTTPWNIVIVQHSDGSVAAYGHMKNGSTTSKNVGDMVVAGEYLGIVGSSGISTGPHLHFEVLTDATFTTIIDPYSGTCNSTTTDSWWQSQRPYTYPGINAALTHNAAPVVFPPCPTAETPNLSNDFETDDAIYFSSFLRDQTSGETVSFEILRPDNSSLFGIWNETVQTTASSWYYLYGPYSGFFDMVGEWSWRVTFEGETVTHTFNVTDALSIKDDDFSQTSVYPNPFNDVIQISSAKKIIKTHIVDILGKSVLIIEDASNGINKIDLSDFSNGMYFLMLESETNEKKTIKLIKE